MSSVLDSHQYEHIERLLYGLSYWEDLGQRKVFLATMLRGHPIWLDLRYGGSQREAAESLLALCGAPDAKLLHGRRPLCALLQVLRAEYGQDPTQLAEIDQLAAGLCMPSRQRVRAVADFLTPEPDWLLAELLCADTDHARRATIGMRLSQIGDPRPGVGVFDGVPDILWCEIPAGAVEIEGHGRFEVSPFRIAAYPVAYAQYRAYLEAEDGYRSKRWWKKLKCEDTPGQQLRPYASYPADYVSWYDAAAFCRWLSERLGYEVRLPDEWEWQWAAQSAREGAVYPWGGEWLDGLANTYESGIGRTTAVGMYPGGRSGQGGYDLAGNVWEWCRGEGGNPKRTGPGGDESRVLRGGSWNNNQDNTRADNRNDHNGFRVLCASHIHHRRSGYRQVQPTKVCWMRWRAGGWRGHVPSVRLPGVGHIAKRGAARAQTPRRLSPPTRSSSPSRKTRRSFACRSRGSSPISSRESVS